VQASTCEEWEQGRQGAEGHDVGAAPEQNRAKRWRITHEAHARPDRGDNVLRGQKAVSPRAAPTAHRRNHGYKREGIQDEDFTGTECRDQESAKRRSDCL
jgi:hypothetical protein